MNTETGGYFMEIRLAENIRTFRKDRHLTQEALAEAMNVNKKEGLEHGQES
jgi:transcriptional regulator with XRE-family HTH domain